MSAQPDALTLPDRRFEVYANRRPHCMLLRDALAGLIVALVAIPLGVGFAIASGLQPEQGVVAGGLAGLLGGVFGGSRYQVYGPTAAFIPLLSGIVAHYGVPFLILASVIAGAIVYLMGVFRLGSYFARVPFSVTVGFTIGIAFSIALGQMPDVLGSPHAVSGEVWTRLQAVLALLAAPDWRAVLMAVGTFLLIRACYRVSVFIPGPLIAIGLAILCNAFFMGGLPLVVISDKFGALSGPLFKLTPPGLDGHAPWELVMPVISIVFIASLESLLSARMADRLAGEVSAYDPNRELIGQGVVNAIVPLLNGFPCTGAFARTATNIKAGAVSPAASMFQGGFVLVLMLFFEPFIGQIPAACIGGLLIFVACGMIKMEEVRHVFRQGRFHAFLAAYTALVTFLTDLFVAVSTATALYYAVRVWFRQPASQPES